MNFGEALEHLKGANGNAVTRSNWYGSHARPTVKLQRPDEHSKMTEPYLYMEKNHPTLENTKVVFPLDLSCESILAEDWVVINQ